MKTVYNTTGDMPEKVELDIAVVGGGNSFKALLDFVRSDSLTYLKVNVVGVCDIDAEAEGMLMAKEMGIYTTTDFRDIFDIKELDIIVDLTRKKEVLLELVKLRPEHIGIVDHNIGQFFNSFLMMNQLVNSMKHQMIVQKMSSDFIMEQSNTAIVALNTDFTIAEANDAYLKIVNQPKENVLGGYCYEIYYGLKAPCPSSRPTLKCPMLETLKTGKTAHVVHEVRTSEEEPNFGHIVAYPLKDQNGEVFRVIEIWTDITHEIASRWEEKTRELKAYLNKMVQEDRMISLGKLSASCVHEINNPIQGLLTLSDLMQEILKEGYPSPENLGKFRHFLSLMSRELERCGNIVSGLLSFSRDSKMEYKSLNFNDILESVIVLTRHRMELQNIELVTDLTPGILRVRGDTNQLQQALLNLIFNAIEVMPEGGRLSVVTELNESEKTIQVRIRDTGDGIPEKDLVHIYEPFFTTKKQGQGTGLGLSIVYGVIKSHGGKINIDSTPGKGTEFTLTFPAL